MKDKLPVINLLPLALALAITISLPLLSNQLPTRLPLFYSLPWGETELVSLGQLLILPAIIVLIDLVNLIINWQLTSDQKLFKQILTLVSIVTSLILTISYLKIITIFF